MAVLTTRLPAARAGTNERVAAVRKLAKHVTCSIERFDTPQEVTLVDFALCSGEAPLDFRRDIRQQSRHEVV